MLRRMLVLLAALSLGYLGLGLLVVLWMTGPKRKSPWATPASVGLEYKEVEVVSTDGISLSAWWVPAGEPDARPPCSSPAGAATSSKSTCCRRFPCTTTPATAC